MIDSDSDVRHLRFLSDLLDRAADVIVASKHLGRPLGMVASIRAVLAGKLSRAEITPPDLEAVPLLLTWIGTELLRVAA